MIASGRGDRLLGERVAAMTGVVVVWVGWPLGRPVALTGDPLLISPWEGEG